jgi:acetyl esterase
VDAAAFPNLDPELADLVALLPDLTRSLDDLPAMRIALAKMLPVGPTPYADELEITDLVVPGDPDVAVRVYRPLAASTDPCAGLLYIHGGGFCLGSVTSENAGAATLAHSLQAVVVSVEYRLAPEHPYPAALEDCYSGLLYLAGLVDVDPERVAVHGASAGGGLAAATALLARDRSGPALCFQSLMIPVLDDRLETPSMRAFDATPLWSRPQAAKSWELYLNGQTANQYAAPGRATDLTGLPPAYVVTCELDPLRDEGLAYASRLLASGISVELHNFPGTFHGSSMVPDAQVVQRMNAES